MPRVVHFEIHAADPERAVRFYRDVFGWEVKKWDGPADYWLISTGDANQPGINGGLLRRHGGPPADGQAVNAFVCTLDVPSTDALVAKATAHGGTVAMPKMAVPGVGWLAYLKDTEGNIFGIMQNDPTAK
jgi:predicted enzyme related to lactoylglutathione lyase